uniref:Mannosyltransferase n=1 Tax=Romanomermis culicivorax TaxID=13658 RepID=A0A915KWU3_ROMCU
MTVIHIQVSRNCAEIWYHFVISSLSIKSTMEKVRIIDASSSVSTTAVSKIFVLAVFGNLFTVYFNPIHDCDETYNYWEILHLFLYGDGLQTWEYSPVYALRSYLYILVVGPFSVAKSLVFMGNFSKIEIFYFCRAFLALLNAYADTRMYDTLRNNKSATLANFYLIFRLFGTGSFVSNSAFLPSSSALWLITLSYASFLKNRNVSFAAIFQIAFAALVCWPFTALLGLPLILDVFWQNWRQLRNFVFFSLCSGLVLCSALLSVDTYFYDQIALTPWNIVKYNVFGAQRGPDLYGTEPWTYYVKNLLINWNLAILLMFLGMVVSKPRRFFLLQVGLLTWFAVFFKQPHKEERFLYPSYSLICMFSAFAMEKMQDILSKFGKYWAKIFVYTFVLSFCLISISRNVSLTVNYKAPLDVYRNFTPKNENPVKICIGKEWYRFPNSFFLPLNSRLYFLRTKFRGILPKPFAENRSFERNLFNFDILAGITRNIPTNMNDLNQEEFDRYIDVQSCDFVVDLDNNEDSLEEPNFSRQKDRFHILSSKDFLLAEKSNVLSRAFYIPYYSAKRNVYGKLPACSSYRQTVIRMMKPLLLLILCVTAEVIIADDVTDTSYECSSKNKCKSPLICRDGICVCSDEYTTDANGNCIKAPIVGDKCALSDGTILDCKGLGVDASCPYDGPSKDKCQCVAGYEQAGKTCRFKDQNLNEKCDSDADCGVAFSSCQNKKCACIDSFKPDGGLCVSADGFKCPSGDPLKESNGKIRVCGVSFRPNEINSTDPSSTFNDSCPVSTHSCFYHPLIRSPSGDLVGHCCPKTDEQTSKQPVCPQGRPLAGAVCSVASDSDSDDSSSTSSDSCPSLTNTCIGVSCCPSPCPGQLSFFASSGRCLAPVMPGSSCKVDAQCGRGASCQNNKGTKVCVCKSGFVLNNDVCERQ